MYHLNSIMGCFISLIVKDELQEKINKLYNVIKKYHPPSDQFVFIDKYMVFWNECFNSFDQNIDLNKAVDFGEFLCHWNELFKQMANENEFHLEDFYEYREKMLKYPTVEPHIGLLDDAINSFANANMKIFWQLKVPDNVMEKVIVEIENIVNEKNIDSCNYTHQY